MITKNFNQLMKNIKIEGTVDSVQPVWICDFTNKQHEIFCKLLEDIGYIFEKGADRDFLRLKSGLIIFKEVQ